MRYGQIRSWTRVAAALLALGGSMAVAAQTAAQVTRVNTYTDSDQQSPAIASDAAGNTVIVWQSNGEDGSLFGIYGQRYSAAGAKIGGEFQINSYTNNMQILPAVAMNASGAFVVVWDSVGQDGNGLSVYGQRYAADGTPQGSAFKINTSTHDMSTQVGVGIDAAGNFAVVWPEHFTSADSTATKTSLIELRIYAADGTPQGDAKAVDTSIENTTRLPVVAMNAGEIVVAWDATARGHLLAGPAGIGVGIRAQKMRADGSHQSATIDINALSTSVVVDHPSVALDANGNFIVAWETLGTDLGARGVHARRYASTGLSVAAEFTVGDSALLQRSPAVAMGASGNFAIAAFNNDGIYLQAYASNGAAQGGSLRVDDASQGNSGALSPALTITPAGVDVTWQDFGRDGSGRGVAARNFSLP